MHTVSTSTLEPEKGFTSAMGSRYWAPWHGQAYVNNKHSLRTLPDLSSFLPQLSYIYWVCILLKDYRYRSQFKSQILKKVIDFFFLANICKEQQKLQTPFERPFNNKSKWIQGPSLGKIKCPSLSLSNSYCYFIVWLQKFLILRRVTRMKRNTDCCKKWNWTDWCLGKANSKN